MFESGSLEKVHLETMEVNLEVSADGKFVFLGSGINAAPLFKLLFVRFLGARVLTPAGDT